MTQEHAMYLMQLNRFKDAEAEWRKVLSEDPDNAIAHGFLSLTLTSLEKIEDAHLEADAAIGLNPENDFFYFIKGKAFLADKRYLNAEVLFQRAIEINPDDADYYSAIAQCRVLRDDKLSALEFSYKSIELDPEDDDNVNLHILILTGLGRHEEAKELMEGVLHRDPHNSYSHSNKGWSELHKNNRKEALIHFREALRLDPENENARIGLIECIKSGNLIYRFMLMYLLWLGKLQPITRWGVIFFGYFLYRLIDRASFVYPEYSIYFKPLLYAYFAFAILTWLSDPFFNLLLFFHKDGRYALKPEEKKSCLIAGIFIGIALVCCILFFAGFHAITLLIALKSAMIVPVVYMSRETENPRHKKFFNLFSYALIIFGAIGLVMVYQENEMGLSFLRYFSYIWIGFFLLNTYLRNRSIG
jgi:tetratricopeptide (TPR) repeat protein